MVEGGSVDRRSLLLVSGAMTDERVWGPLLQRLPGWDVEVVPWPLGPRADPLPAVREQAGDRVFDVVLAAGGGAPAGVELARQGQAGALVLVGGNDFDAVRGRGLDHVEGAAVMAMAFEAMPFDPEGLLEAMEAGDPERGAGLVVDAMVGQVAEGPLAAHRDLLTSMLGGYVGSLPFGPESAPVHHRWAAWLGEVEVPVLLVRAERSLTPGSMGARSLQTLARACPTARFAVLPLGETDMAGLSHPDELAALVEAVATDPGSTGESIELPDPDEGPQPEDPGEADLDAAVAVVTAYLSASEDDDEAMAQARRAAAEHDPGDVVDGLVLLAVTLLAGRQGERGVSAEESLEEFARIARVIRGLGRDLG